MTYRDDIEGLDASILMHPKVWEASGHVENFTDPMVDCTQCKSRYRLDTLGAMISKKVKEKVFKFTFDQLITNALLNECLKLDYKFFAGTKLSEFYDVLNDYLKNPENEERYLEVLLSDSKTFLQLKNIIICPNCGNSGTFTEARKFNLMFKTFVGAVEDSGSVVYLRPETAQGIYVNFLNVQQSSRQKIPFGIAQIGKAFRNEINTKNFLFRTREFEQMEMQFFINPSEDKKWYDYWKYERLEWFKSLGMTKENLRYHDHPPNKLAHYAKEATDIEYQFPFGWGEIEGIHNRTNYDLTRHEQFSGKSLKYFDESLNEKYIPYIIETSAGASRSFMAFLIDSYAEEEVRGENRSILKFHPRLAPTKAAVLPLVNKDGMQEISQKIEKDLRKRLKVFYDDKGAIGRRYRRQDEAGTPFCITIDTQTLEDQTVTVRERDSMDQIRIGSSNSLKYLLEKLHVD